MDNNPKTIREVIQGLSKPLTISSRPAIKEPYSGPCSEDCEICHGIGWIHHDRQPGEAGFGQLDLCPNATKRHTQNRCGLYYDEVEDLNWSQIRPFSASTTLASDAVKEVIERGYGLVYLWGDHGLAKTLILKIAVAETVRRGAQGFYALVSDVLDEIRDAYSETDPAESAVERIERLTSSYLLCLDELERISETGWAKEKVFQILDRRHVSAIRQETITLIASNTSPANLSPALADRFSDGRHKVIQVTGASARPHMSEGFRY